MQDHLSVDLVSWVTALLCLLMLLSAVDPLAMTQFWRDISGRGDLPVGGGLCEF